MVLSIDVLSIILAIVALFITIIGFFASLKFYRDGMTLQNKANEAQVRIEEMARAIQGQVTGMFDKTLDAAIRQKGEIDMSFSRLDEQVQNSAQELKESLIQEIGTAGAEERQRIENLVDEKMSLIRSRVDETRESTEEAEGFLTSQDVVRLIREGLLEADQIAAAVRKAQRDADRMFGIRARKLQREQREEHPK